MNLILVIGGVSYWLFPVIGPFIFREGENALATLTQQFMFGAYQQVRHTGIFPAGYFVSPLAAMPSLHIAHSIFFTISVKRVAPYLLFFYVPISAWIVIESVASGWHYFLDLPAGLVVMLLSMFIAQLIIKPNTTGEMN